MSAATVVAGYNELAARQRPTLVGEKCTLCPQPAAHKIAEELHADPADPFSAIHPMTATVCADCFKRIFSPYLFKQKLPAGIEVPRHKTIVLWKDGLEHRVSGLTTLRHTPLDEADERNGIVRYVPELSTTEQRSWVLTSSGRLPQPGKLVQFSLHDATGPCVGYRNGERGHGHEWEDLTQQDMCCDSATYSDDQVYAWRELATEPERGEVVASG